MKKYRVNVDGKVKEVCLQSREGNLLSFSVGSNSYKVEVEPVFESINSQPSGVTVLAPKSSSKSAKAKHGEILAPMPGIIVDICVEVGSKVSSGETLLIMEAMKMENNIPSPTDGTVKEIKVKVGDEVDNDQLLVLLD